ncbi:SWI/SNF complex subunit SWI3D-like isoform X2 [Papaver somniferum]|uniref:SWI/SNF complex subunit SWI3D-like isoform X2 n=1 Tax=Papaver somniferum TaxID=3469 RepID=UPI000E705F8D|nr:SWI/SNF complex subunit SWI3D-like isoform X2 [Papaver somniferum]
MEGGKGKGETNTSATSTTTSNSKQPQQVVGAPQNQQQQPGPRRRNGALKRKAANNSSSAGPSKRLTRERNNLIPHHILYNNGPITRARQSPNKFGASESSAAVSAGGSGVTSSSTVSTPQNLNDPLPNPVSSVDGEIINTIEESNKTKYEELERDLDPVIDAEFEAVRSHGDAAHVIPTHAGWFSWEKVHPLEEHALQSFFNGESEKRTPDSYMEIRNLIVKKFHEDPKASFDSKDLPELSAGELDDRQEVMAFLDHWGLINFKPFPLADASMALPDGDGATKTSSLVEKLYHFEAVESRPWGSFKPDLAAPVLPPRLYPESFIAEEVRPEGPAVEYHCNSCSGDCSRKRYHCQKQADFDLCSECYNNGKFDAGMSHADFILMESAEPGVNGGSWTDQETLLLLEALELFGPNWSEIAEHVATKTKTQCILHFVQMPIEDSFFEVRPAKDDVEANLEANIVTGSSANDLSGLKDAPGTKESKVEPDIDSNSVEITPDTTKGKSAIDSDSPAKKDALAETTKDQSVTHEEQPLSPSMDISKPKDTIEVNLAVETSANIALNALKEAFQTVGSLPEPGEKFSFTEAGNPVMALAAYLAGLVEFDYAAASTRSSLKIISDKSAAIQLAARHCFVLEDSTDTGNIPSVIESFDLEMSDKVVQKEEQNIQENSTSVLDGSSTTTTSPKKKSEEAIQKEKESLFSSGDEGKSTLSSAKILDDETVPQNDTPVVEKEPSDSALPREDTPNVVKESSDSTLPHEEPASTAIESVDVPLPAQATPSSVKESSGAVEEASECPETPEAPEAVDKLSNTASLEAKEFKQAAACNLTVENGENTGNDDKKVIGIKEEKDIGLNKNKDDHNIQRIKRAAITALSAAAVKAKLLAKQEEDEIQQLATFLIDKQKLELKLSFFTEMESVITRVREQMDRSRQKLYQERAQIIASRLGYPASASRTVMPSFPTNRVAMSYANALPRQQPGTNFQRPQMMASMVRPSGPHLSTPSIPSRTVAGASPNNT